MRLTPLRLLVMAALAASLDVKLMSSTRQDPRGASATPREISAPLPPGIIGWWRGEGNANDSVGGHNGIALNGAAFGPGMVGTAFTFDGINDVISIPDVPSLQLAASPKTIEMWAFRTTGAVPVHLFGRRVGCGGTLDFYQMAIGANAFSSASVPLNTWVHLALTYDGAVQRHYVNGVLVLQQAASFATSAVSTPLLIGSAGTCQPFAGMLDEVSLYNRALSQSEILTIAAAGPDGKTPPAARQPPSGLTAVVNGTSVFLSWNAVAGALSYRLRAGTTSGASNAFDGNVGNVLALSAGASPGTYFVRVHAVDATGESGPSNEVRIDLPGGCALPGAPSQLVAMVNGSSVTLNWIAGANATSYVIEAGSSNGAANLAMVDSGTAAPTFSAAGPPGSYFVRVRARNGCGTGAASNEVIVILGGTL